MVIMANGSTQPLKYKIKLSLIIGNYIKNLIFQIANISPAPIILGIIWLEIYNPNID